MRAKRWWIFDRPVRRDPLFLIGLGLGLVSFVRVVTTNEDYGAVEVLVALVTSIAVGVLASGIVLGSVREYLRGRPERST